jgi:hypothetical protein
MRMQVHQLECIRTKPGEHREEPVLRWRVDSDNNRSGCWHPDGDMRTGDTVYVDLEIEGTNRIEMYLWEYDSGENFDDCVGGLNFSPDATEGITLEFPGSYAFDLPYHADGSGYGRSRHYKLYCSLFLDEEEHEHLPRIPYCLQLRDLHCSDAQEGTDEVFIKVNGVKVGGPFDMKTGDYVTIGEGAIRIPAITEISIWEEDEANRSDFIGSVNLQITEDFDFTQIHGPISFSRDDGIVGDATYTLTYSVYQRVIARGDYRC